MAAKEWVVVSAFRDVGGVMVMPGTEDWSPANPQSAEKLKKAGCITEKVASPFPGETTEEPSSSSPLGPVPEQFSLSSPEGGPSSPSTTGGESSLGPKRSTPATGRGGSTTKKKSAATSRAKAGRKTAKQQKSTDSTTSAAKSGPDSASNTA